MTRQTILLTALLSIAGCIQASGQGIHITGFTEDASPASLTSDLPAAPRDPDGEPCAVLLMETKQKGWTFEAGLAGIVDVSYGEESVVLWLPAGARTITVAHPTYGVLRDWRIPVTLSPGHTYSMKLDVSRPKPAYAPARRVTPPLPVRTVSPARQQDDARRPCSHFIDAWAGSVLEEGEVADCHFFGIRYTFMGRKLGPYAAAGLSGDDDYSFSGGLALRLGDGTSNPDWHIYAGGGLIDGCGLLGEAGVRVAWLSDRKVSRWDFGVGCQVWEGCVMPTVEVGLCIWGIPVCLCLGIALGAI